MTPTQRAAAERLADALQSGADDPMWAHHAEIKKSTLGYAAALLRELAAGPVVNQQMTTEPVQEPVAAELPAPQLLVESAQGFVEGWTRSQVRSAINLALLKRRYAAPQQRKPLTDEQIDDLWRGQSPAHLTVARAFARAIERAITGEPT